MKRWTFKRAKEAIEALDGYELCRNDPPVYEPGLRAPRGCIGGFLGRSCPYAVKVVREDDEPGEELWLDAATLDEAVGYAAWANDGIRTIPSPDTAVTFGQRVLKGERTLVNPPTTQTKTITLSFNVPVDLDTPSEVLAAIKQSLLDAAAYTTMKTGTFDKDDPYLHAVLVEC
jgi:hypothetical protein